MALKKKAQAATNKSKVTKSNRLAPRNRRRVSIFFSLGKRELRNNFEDGELDEVDDTDFEPFKLVGDTLTFFEEFSTEAERDAFLLGFEVTHGLGYYDDSESFLMGVQAGLKMAGKQSPLVADRKQLFVGPSPAEEKKRHAAFIYGQDIGDEAAKLDCSEYYGDEKRMKIHESMKDLLTGRVLHFEGL